MKPLAFRPDIHPGRVAASTKPTMRDVVEYRPTVVGLQQRLLALLVDGPRSMDQLIAEIYGGVREPDNAVHIISSSISEVSRKLKDGWRIERERRYVLVKR